MTILAPGHDQEFAVRILGSRSDEGVSTGGIVIGVVGLAANAMMSRTRPSSGD